MKNILITKKIEQPHLFSSILNKGSTLDETPFIHLTPLHFKCPKAYDWIFFSSKNAVKFFLNSCEIPSHTKIAVVSSATEKALTVLGYNVQFCGNPSINTEENAENFAKLVGEESVVFPSSNLSLKTFPLAFSSSKNISIIQVYQTHIQALQLNQNYDCYVFTSPSNVNGFFEKNKLPEKAKVMAIGNTTAQHLQKFTKKNIYLPEAYSEASIANKLLAILNKG